MMLANGDKQSYLRLLRCIIYFLVIQSRESMKFFLNKKILSTVKDHRHSSYVVHNLADVLSMVILAMFNGNDFLGEIYTYLIDKKDF